MISKEPLSVILLASKLGYQTRSFAEAARRLGVGVIVGSDRCQQLENPCADGAVPLHFEELRNAAARLVEAVSLELREHPCEPNIGASLAFGHGSTAAA